MRDAGVVLSGWCTVPGLPRAPAPQMHLSNDGRVQREEAAARASQLNRELGEQGVLDAYYIEVEESPGNWTVDKRTEEPKKRGRLRKFFDALLESGGPS
jgi:hypothetical protein